MDACPLLRPIYLRTIAIRALPSIGDCIGRAARLRGASLHHELYVPARCIASEELVERARELGYAALAITDECSVAGVVRAHVAIKKDGSAQRSENGGADRTVSI